MQSIKTILFVLINFILINCSTDIPIKGKEDPLKKVSNLVSKKYSCATSISIVRVLNKLDYYLININVDSVNAVEESNYKKVISEII